MTELTEEPSSYRDSSSKVYYFGDDVFRGLNEQALTNWTLLESTQFFKKLSSQNKIVYTERIESQENIGGMSHWAAHLKHTPIPFISYPYEWSFYMLKDAALLHLELIDEALSEDFILKDASSYNVQWTGAQPTFIDIPSFVPYTQNTPWVGYKQFCELFLYPLLLTAHKNINFQSWLRGSIDGIRAQQLSNLMCTRDYFNPTFLANVYLNAKFQTRYNNANVDTTKKLASFGFTKKLIKNNINRLQSQISRLKTKSNISAWSDYTEENSYSSDDERTKIRFIEKHLSHSSYKLAWDIGCNTGEYSRIAARHSEYVVSLDADPLCIDLLYESLKQEGIDNVLPLAIDITDPSPNLGWLERERKSITNRNSPDLILCLALIHHIVITRNVPLGSFISWLRNFNSILFIEFVTKEDPMTQRLLINKEDQYDDYTTTQFEALLGSQFLIVDSKLLKSGTRKLYFVKPS